MVLLIITSVASINLHLITQLLNNCSGVADTRLLLLLAVHVKDHGVSNRSVPSPVSRIDINNKHHVENRPGSP